MFRNIYHRAKNRGNDTKFSAFVSLPHYYSFFIPIYIYLSLFFHEQKKSAPARFFRRHGSAECIRASLTDVLFYFCLKQTIYILEIIGQSEPIAAACHIGTARNAVVIQIVVVGAVVLAVRSSHGTVKVTVEQIVDGELYG